MCGQYTNLGCFSATASLSASGSLARMMELPSSLAVLMAKSYKYQCECRSCKQLMAQQSLIRTGWYQVIVFQFLLLVHATSSISISCHTTGIWRNKTFLWPLWMLYTFLFFPKHYQSKFPGITKSHTLLHDVFIEDSTGIMPSSYAMLNIRRQRPNVREP